MSITRRAQKNIKTNQKSNDFLNKLGDISSEDKKWLNECPTRVEIINYVNAIWEHNYLPTITNYIQLSSMVLQAILIDKGICTGDEIKDITEKFVQEQQRRIAGNNDDEKTGAANDDDDDKLSTSNSSDEEEDNEKSKEQGE